MARFATAIALSLLLATTSCSADKGQECSTLRHAIDACIQDGFECCSFVGRFFRAGCYCPNDCRGEGGDFDAAFQGLIMAEMGMEWAYHTCRKVAPEEFDVSKPLKLTAGSLRVDYGQQQAQQQEQQAQQQEQQWRGLADVLGSLYEFLMLPFTYPEEAGNGGSAAAAIDPSYYMANDDDVLHNAASTAAAAADKVPAGDEARWEAEYWQWLQQVEAERAAKARSEEFQKEEEEESSEARRLREAAELDAAWAAFDAELAAADAEALALSHAEDKAATAAAAASTDDGDEYGDAIAAALAALDLMQLEHEEDGAEAAAAANAQLLQQQSDAALARLAATLSSNLGGSGGATVTDSDAELEALAAEAEAEQAAASDMLLDPSFRPSGAAVRTTDPEAGTAASEGELLALAGLFGGSEHRHLHRGLPAFRDRPEGWEAMDRADMPSTATAAGAQDWDGELEEDVWAWLNGPAPGAHYKTRAEQQGQGQREADVGAGDGVEAVMLGGMLDRAAASRAFALPRNAVPSAPSVLQATLAWVCAHYWNILITLSAFNFVGFALVMARMYHLERRAAACAACSRAAGDCADQYLQQQQQQQQPSVRDMEAADLLIVHASNPLYAGEVRAFVDDVRSTLLEGPSSASLRAPLLSNQH